MDDNVIDSLAIEITSDIADAEKGIEKIEGTLKRLKSSFEKFKIPSDGLQGKLKGLSQGLHAFDSLDTNHLNRVGEAVRGLSSGVSSLAWLHDGISDRLRDIAGGLGNIANAPAAAFENLERLAAINLPNIQADGMNGARDLLESLAAFDVSHAMQTAEAMPTLANGFDEVARVCSSGRFAQAIENIESLQRQDFPSLTSPAADLRQFQRVETMPEVTKPKMPDILSIFPRDAGKKILGTGAAGVTKLFESVSKRAFSMASGLQRVTNMFKRLVTFRAFSAILRRISEGLQEGRENLYQYSKAIGGEFARSMDRARTNAAYFNNSIAAAAAPLINAFAPALDIVTEKAVNLANTLNQAFAKITGAATWTKAVKYPLEYAAATNEAADALKSFQMGFDELNVLDSSSSLTSANAVDYSSMFMEMPTGNGFDNLEKLFDPVKKAWDQFSGELLASVETTISKVLGMFSAIGKSIAEVWTNGSGEEIAGAFIRTFTNVFTAIGNLADRFKEAWENGDTGTRIIQNATDHLLILLNTVERCTGIFAEWSATFDFSGLLNSFAVLLETATPIFEGLGDTVAWVWESVLLPLGKWTIEDALPASLDVLSGALDVLRAAADALKPYGMWLWDEFITPFANWSGDIITTGLEKLSDALHTLGGWIDSHPDAAVYIGGLATAFLGLNTVLSGGLVAKSVSSLGSLIAALGGLNVTVGVIAAGLISWGYVITELHDNWGDIMDVLKDTGGVFGFVSGWIEYCRDDIEKFFDGFGELGEKWRKLWERVGEYVYTKVHFITDVFDFCKTMFKNTIDKIRNGFIEIRDFVKQTIGRVPEFFREKFTTVYERITTPFANVKQWATDRLEDIKAPFRTIAEWFHDTFSDAWQRVLDVFSKDGTVFEGIQTGIAATFTKVVNGLIDGINNTVSVPFNAINSALDTVRNWGIWLPWAGDWYPFQSLPNIWTPQIPHINQYESGGYPPSGELFMANENGIPEMVGRIGNRTAVANNDQIFDAIAEGVAMAVQNVLESNQSGDRPINMNLYIDGRQLLHTLKKVDQGSGATIYGGAVALS